MRFPFVPRSVYEDVRAMLAHEQHRVDDLTQLVADMKVAGGTVIRGSTTRHIQPPPRPEWKAIEQAIDENPLAQSDPMLRRHLVETAERELERGVRPEDIEAEMAGWYRGAATVATDDEDDDES